MFLVVLNELAIQCVIAIYRCGSCTLLCTLFTGFVVGTKFNMNSVIKKIVFWKGGDIYVQEASSFTFWNSKAHQETWTHNLMSI